MLIVANLFTKLFKFVRKFSLYNCHFHAACDYQTQYYFNFLYLNNLSSLDAHHFHLFLFLQSIKKDNKLKVTKLQVNKYKIIQKSHVHHTWISGYQ